jgi:hypothetical protein
VHATDDAAIVAWTVKPGQLRSVAASVAGSKLMGTRRTS